MRFVIAIVAFVAAAVMVVAGIGQRTIWAPPTTATARATLDGSATSGVGTQFLVIGGHSLNALGDQQTLQISGAKSPFVAYGTTTDVLSWIGRQQFTRLAFDNGALTQTVQTVDTMQFPGALTVPAAAAASPVGSDLWLSSYSGADAAYIPLNVPDDVSVLIETGNPVGGTPATVTVRWRLIATTPWAGPLIVGGIVMLVVGLVLYFYALRHLRRSRGPRRGGRPPRLPRPPRVRRVSGAVPAAVESRHGRRSSGRATLIGAVLTAGALALGGCSADYWPSMGGASQPAAAETTLPAGQGTVPTPTVTEHQVETIVDAIAAAAKQADAALEASKLADRFTGAALRQRKITYVIRKKVRSYPAAAAIPSASLALVVPEATDSWPRTVSVVVKGTDPRTAPIDLLLTQENPRANYQVAYAISLEAGAQVPQVAAAGVGSALVPPDSKLLKIAPNQLAAAYGSVLAKGAKSPFYKLFDMKADKLAPQIGSAYKAKQIAGAAAAKTSSLTFIDAAAPDAPLALATVDAGALVAVAVDETKQQKATQSGATVALDNPNGPTAALTGLTKSSTGFQVTFEYQLLFSVPPAESTDAVRLIGYSEAAVSAKELK
ncbi:hypothetical protein [Gryllotalpicola sp.]|uniref:hypothetical protein n=1 Tax=Gryllotalpicola sp. TaxID=1932787 RepID=UPI0026094C39|nr:hypothetical protein [Gryllotalpicola sp.]